MKKAKLGDVYAFKTERGYRLLHWAYTISKYGNYVRVLPNFYQDRPSDISDIIDSDCAYILDFNVSKLYRKGLLELWGNYPISEKFPFPSHDISYTPLSNFGEFQVCESTCHQHFETFIGDHTGNVLPLKYKNIKLICGSVDPIWFIYLISSDFDLTHWNLYWPEEKWDEYDQKYGDLIFGKIKK